MSRLVISYHCSSLGRFIATGLFQELGFLHNCLPPHLHTPWVISYLALHSTTRLLGGKNIQAISLTDPQLYTDVIISQIVRRNNARLVSVLTRRGSQGADVFVTFSVARGVSDTDVRPEDFRALLDPWRHARVTNGALFGVSCHIHPRYLHRLIGYLVRSCPIDFFTYSLIP